MEKQLRPLEEIVRKLPLEFQKEVRDFAEFLLEKQRKKRDINCVRIGLCIKRVSRPIYVIGASEKSSSVAG